MSVNSALGRQKEEDPWNLLQVQQEIWSQKREKIEEEILYRPVASTCTHKGRYILFQGNIAGIAFYLLIILTSCLFMDNNWVFMAIVFFLKSHVSEADICTVFPFLLKERKDVSHKLNARLGRQNQLTVVNWGDSGVESLCNMQELVLHTLLLEACTSLSEW